jgi:hypothetical protein
MAYFPLYFWEIYLLTPKMGATEHKKSSKASAVKVLGYFKFSKIESFQFPQF